MRWLIKRVNNRGNSRETTVTGRNTHLYYRTKPTIKRITHTCTFGSRLKHKSVIHRLVIKLLEVIKAMARESYLKFVCTGT